MEKIDISQLTDSLLERDIAFEMPAEGTSMFPLVLPGTRLQVRKADISQLKKGDIVAYRNASDTYIAHRIVLIDNNMIVCRGDSNMTCDRPVGHGSIMGLVFGMRCGRFRFDLRRKPFALYGRMTQALHPASTRLINIALRSGRAVRRLFRKTKRPPQNAAQ